MSMNQFYLTLPSTTHAGCTPANFHVNLPQRIKLDGEWEVGLAEIIYPNNWHNVKDKENIVKLAYVEDGSSNIQYVDMFIPVGHYTSIKELIDAISNICHIFPLKTSANISVEYPATFIYNEQSNKVSVRIKTSTLTGLRLHNHIAFLLGFNDDTIYVSSPEDSGIETIYAPRSASIRSGLDHMYIYCDVVENQMVGNVMSPLIRIVDVQGQYMQICSKIYDNPHYVPVVLKDIASIEINIKNELNEFISFQFGSVIVKLHFRRCSIIPIF